MVRSSGVPRSMGLRHIRKIIQSRQSPTEVTQIDYTTNEWDEEVEQTNTVTTDLWLYQGTSRLVQELLGERTVGTLNAIGTYPTNVKLDDRLTYNGITYEVVERTPMPEDDPQIVAFGCTERQQ